MKYLCRLMEIFVLSYFINENRNNFYMKTKLYFYSQPNYLTRTAIEAKILFAVCLSKKQALTGGKSLASKDKCSKKIGAESAVLHFVFFMIIINKMQQSAKIKLLINLPTDRTFGNRWSRYKEPSKNKAEAYRVYVEHLFLRSDAGDARIFSKEKDVYGIDYGFGLDAPIETEQANPQDLFAYRRNYTWNERNLLTKSSDRNFTVHYRYGDDGQRALKYTDEGRSETLYFNNFFTIHIPTQDQNNPQGLRVHKHIFVGNSRLVTAMTHTDNSGDNEEQKAKRYYYHSDHLGSAQFVTDWKGRQYEHIEYTPYGELWIEEVAAGLDKLPFRFTGKELDEETGLYYYGARYLDPKYSRWLSGDPALGEYMAGSSVGEGGIYNTVNFNVYHYGSNNPIKYTDPTGRYDKEEYKAFKALTRQEKNVILSSISKSKTVNRMANEAWDKTNVTFGGNGRYDQSDAFRHGYWMGRNTQEAGEKFTRKFGDAHEYATNPDPKEFPRNDIIMDIHNNDVGIEVGKKNPTATPEELAKKILEKINNGDMLIMNDKTGLLYKSNDTEYKNPLSVDDPFIRRPDVSKKIADYILKDQKTEEVKE